MSKAFQPKSGFGPVGVSVMVGVHLLIGNALLSGLARKAVEVVKKPLDATIVQEVKLPPPPPPPPKPQIKHEPPPTQAPPPPSYVPPPEVVAPAEPAPQAITSVQTAQPQAPPPAAPPTPAPTPAPGPLQQDIGVACPKQVRPVMPAKAEEEGISGTVRAEARIRGGSVVDVRILSGPKVYQAAVRSAMLQYQCVGGSSDVIAVQEFVFKVE